MTRSPCPDAVTVDDDGRIWIGTDMFAAEMGAGPYTNLKNNVLLAADPARGVPPLPRRLRGLPRSPASPSHPSVKAMFVDIQHPGEPNSIFTARLADVLCHWPDGGESRPRSATLVITKDDGGVIGT